MKVLVFIDHDIICRHFIMSGALRPLVETADIRFVFPEVGGTRVTLDPDGLSLGAPHDRLPIDARRQQMWRWLLYADQLKWRLGAQEAAIRRIRWETLGWKAALLLTVAGLPGIEWIFRRVIERRMKKAPNTGLSDLLVRTKPDLVLHPTVLDGVFCNDLVFECKARGVPVVFAMNSWDNPSTKRAMVGAPDYLLVWGAQTREHAIRFVGAAPDRVVSFGAAQFDVFRTEPRIDRATFCADHGIDTKQRIVLFAGSNAQTDEFSALAAIDEAIARGSLPGVAVVYRPHPWGGGGRNGARLAGAKFRHVVVDRTMHSYIEALGRGDQRITLPDYRDTHDLLSTVDAVVSPLSTILLEGIMHGLPVVVFAVGGEDQSRLLARILPMVHFDEFLKLPDMPIARSVDELIALMPRIADAVDGPALGARLKQKAEWFVSPFDRPWNQRIVEFLTSRAGTSARVKTKATE